MAEIFGNTVEVVETQLRFRLTRQSVLASNLANVDTPGYRRAELHFDQALGKAMQPLARTHERHVADSDSIRPGWRLEVERGSTRPDRNGVNLDREVVELNRNAGAFTEQAAVLSRLYGLRRLATDQGR